ncbi:hypothetical protein AB0I22_35235 [Streptomyces sp. NPDC050610]|uniref:hypothetical protein n=1 Tax=Streptomyces sp. NPDC050610 TaxID=3157097 RepID=UPI00342A8D00
MAAFTEEWAQLKQESSKAAGMTLASAGDGGGADGLKSDRAAWSAAAQGVGDIARKVSKALGELEKGQKGLGAGTGAGVLSTVAQRDLYASWKRYLEDVFGRCDALEEPLRKAGDAHFKNDEDTKSAFTAVGEKYKETPAVGGAKKGR